MARATIRVVATARVVLRVMAIAKAVQAAAIARAVRVVAITKAIALRTRLKVTTRRVDQNKAQVIPPAKMRSRQTD